MSFISLLCSTPLALSPRTGWVLELGELALEVLDEPTPLALRPEERAEIDNGGLEAGTAVVYLEHCEVEVEAWGVSLGPMDWERGSGKAISARDWARSSSAVGRSVPGG